MMLNARPSLSMAFPLAAAALTVAAAALIVAAAPAQAADQIPWVTDFQAACGMAAEQHRLVLLHFYNDNCGPCVRVDQNVFSRAEVAEAISQNYLAVKVHAGKSPQLASRYRVQQWPTDVFVTPSGLEVYRTISSQKPDDFIAVLNQIAMQSGVGTARQWKSQLPQTIGAAANTAQTATKTMADNAQRVTEQTVQQAATRAQQSTTAAGQWSQQAREAVQQYEKQGGDSYRQFRQQTGEVGQQVPQQAESTRQQWQAAAQKANEKVGQAASGLKDQMHQASQSLVDRRSAFVPADQSPASGPTAPAATSAANSPAASGTASASSAAQTPPATTPPEIAKAPPPTLTTNPWVAGNQPAASAAPAVQPSDPNSAASAQPAFVPAQPQTPAAGLDSNLASRQMVPVSQAPPIALDGFCPVTLREVIDHNPGDRGAWKKGDRRFGAVHDGRTYLFVSAEQQQKFLANPDAYAPVLSGCDPVLLAERGQMVDGKRAYGLITADHQVYLFADEATLNRFKQAPGNYAGAIQQAKARAETGNVYR
jgi:YHS domain-containing protein/thioredoxin-related protein